MGDQPENREESRMTCKRYDIPKTLIWEAWLMSAGSYFPPPVKAVPIPKKSGGVRILGIPTVADRIGQTAIKMWLEPRLDPIFHEDSYGYRPGKSALTAIAVTRRRCWDTDWVVEFDIRGLFDNLDHDLLMTSRLPSFQTTPKALLKTVCSARVVANCSMRGWSLFFGIFGISS